MISDNKTKELGVGKDPHVLELPGRSMTSREVRPGAEQDCPDRL